MKRLTALFLAVIMLLALLPAGAFAATSKLIISDAPGGSSVKEIDMSAKASGNGWQWDASNKTLTLNGFNGEYIQAGGDMKIVLKGKNTVTLPKRGEFGIKVDGRLTIDKSSSSSTDTLTVTQTTTASASNLILTGGSGDSKSCVINGGTVTLTNTTSGGNGCGVYYRCDVNNDANLIISVPYRGVNSTLTTNTKGKVEIATTGNNAFAAAVYALNAKGAGPVTLTAKTPASAVYNSVNIASTSGNVTMNGVTRVGSDPLNNFTVAYNKKLSNSDSYYQGYYTSDAAGNTGYFLTDSQGNPLSKAAYVTVDGQKLVVMDSPLYDLTDIRVGQPVKSAIGIINGTRGGAGNYRFYLKSGSKLPDGLTLDEYKGSISGTPTGPCEAGSFTVVVKDKKGASGCSSAEVSVKYSAIKASDEYITIGAFGRFNMNTKNLASEDLKWKYTAATHTLELSGYNGGPISADANLNIVLSGQSSVNLPGTADTGIYVNGKLTIDCATNSVTDMLTVQQTTTSTSANLIVTGGTGEAKSLEINGGTVNLVCSKSAVNSVGVKNWVYVNNDAILNIFNAGYRGAGSKLICRTNGAVTVDSLGLANGAAAAYSLDASGSGIVTLGALGAASTVFDSLTVADTAGRVILNGVTMVEEKPYQNFSVAANKQLFDGDSNAIPNYYMGYGCLGNAGLGYYLTDNRGNILPSALITTQSNQPLTVMDSDLFNLPDMKVGEKLETNIYLLNATRGGSGDYRYSVRSGSELPKGLTLNEKTGEISGIPLAPSEPDNCYIVVKDNAGALGCSKVELVITYGQVLPCALGVPSISSSCNEASGKITVKWATVPGAAKYEIYRATSQNGTYSRMYTTTNTSYTNTSAEAGKTYYYKVKAIGYDGTVGKFSNVTYRTCDCARPVVTASNVSSSGRVSLKWSAISGAAKYEIWRATKIDGTYSRMYTTTSTSYTNTSAEAGKTYYYKVKALSSKTSSADSAFSEVVKRVCCCAQPVVTASNSSSTGKVSLKWSAVAGAAKYEIWRATSKNGTYTRMYTTTLTSYTNTSSVAGKTYYYKVKAIASTTSDANSVFSAVVSRTCDCAKPVVSITRNLTNGKPKLIWDAVDGADKYVIYRAESKNGKYTKMYTTTATNYTNTSAKANYSYFYKIVAVSNQSSYADSVYSDVVSITSK